MNCSEAKLVAPFAELRMPDVPPTTLTTSDYFMLQALELSGSEDGHWLAAFLRRKLSTAMVAFPADVARDVATIGSELHYRVGPRSEIRLLLPHDRVENGGLYVGSRHGLALVGMRKGQTLDMAGQGGVMERLELQDVRRAN